MASKLIKQIKVCHPGGKDHGEVLDLLIKNGKVEQSGRGIKAAADEVIEGKRKIITPGWFDLHVRFHEPGNEHKEDLITGAAAARNGGFTGVMLSPDTDPACDTKSVAEYLTARGRKLPVDILVSGALSRNLEGRELSEMYDMYSAGVNIFHDDKRSLENPDFLKRAMLYAQSVNVRLMTFPEELMLTRGGVVNEGSSSVFTGLKTMPSLAEWLRVNRDLALAEYCEAPIHFSCISCAESVQLIRAAKKRGLHVTCDVPYMNLVLTDRDTESFDTRLKLNPPLRTEKDRKALIKGLIDGTIDAITSDHSPENPEEKECEFDNAAFGMSSIETIYPVYREFLSDELDLDTFVNALTNGPDRILNRKRNSFETGAKADFTIISPGEQTQLSPEFFKSKSKSNFWMNQSLKGKVTGVIKKK